jgi:PilZ domain
MPELLRSIAARLRAYVGNRRNAPRFRVRLPCAVRLEGRRPVASPRAAVTVEAFTRDLSQTGLALVVPSVRVGERYLTESPLRLRLEHPTGPLEIVVAPVRYEQLEPEDEDEGFLIGVRITSISDADRARYDEYLDQLR